MLLDELNLAPPNEELASRLISGRLIAVDGGQSNVRCNDTTVRATRMILPA